MLQIITGKFYQSDERFHNECKALLFSNIGSIEGIKTSVFNLIPTSYSSGDGYSFVVEYDNQIQKPIQPTSLMLIKVGDKEIVSQIQTVASFASNGIFTTDKNVLSKICRDNGSTDTSDAPPSKYIEKTLSFRYLENNEVAFFTDFVDKLMLLEREKYSAVLQCLKTYNAAIKLLDDDVCLAYSMLVYCVESLSQKFDKYEPTWDDFDQNKKGKIESLIACISEPIGNQLKEILIADQHLKLSARFVNFVVENLDEDFYTVEASKVIAPLQKHELIIALKNTYYIRSGYVHELKRPTPQLLMANFSKNCDTFRYDNNTYLTYNGLLRVVRKVIISFAMKQKSVEKEKYNWYNELPNSFSMPLSPELWVYNANGASRENALHYYTGFLKCYLSGKSELPNMKNVLAKFQKIFDNVSEINKCAIFALTKLYNSVIRESDRSEGYENFLSKNSKVVNLCNIINISLSVLPIPMTEGDSLWDVELCEKQIENYMKQRYKPNKLRFDNSIIETIIFITLANRYKDEGNKEKYVYWMESAFYNLSGNYDLQKELRVSIKEYAEFDIEIIYKKIFEAKANENTV